MLQLLPARVGMKRSPDLTLTGLQVALTHWDEQEEEKKKRDVNKKDINPTNRIFSSLNMEHEGTIAGGASSQETVQVMGLKSDMSVLLSVCLTFDRRASAGRFWWLICLSSRLS